jgi:hypothetical protein
MTATPFDPSPGQWDGSPPISDCDHHQLMPGSYLAGIDNQTDLAVRDALNNVPGDRLIPPSDIQRWIAQEPTESPCQAWQTSGTRDLLGYLAQMDRATLVQANQQPGQIPNSGDPFIWTQFANPSAPVVVKFYCRHCSSPTMVFDTHNVSEEHADFLKLSGS